MKGFFCFLVAGFSIKAVAQNRPQRILNAWKTFTADSQMRHAIAGFVVYDTKTGKLLFDQNGQKGLAPASTQKIVTSVAAYELLGSGFTFKTIFRLVKTQSAGPATLEIIGSGDPTLGSWRYGYTKDSVIAAQLVKALQGRPEWRADGPARVLIMENKAGGPLPGGFTWEDMGNYYGAGSRQFNWHENQYDLYFNSDNSGNATLSRTDPAQLQLEFRNRVRADRAITGDEIYVLAAPWSRTVYLEGGMPVNKKDFVVSGSMPDPAQTFVDFLASKLNTKLALTIHDRYSKVIVNDINEGAVLSDTLYVHLSPAYDSINFHFLRRSVNLYGESLVKAIAMQRGEEGTTEAGVERIRNFYATQGIDKASINIIDGSGLSPQNRVTADALARILLYARKRPWYGSFYQALPEYNGMKMKSGSIGGARAFAGFCKSADNSEYAFSIIVNNFDGSATSIVRKIYKLLDALK